MYFNCLHLKVVGNKGRFFCCCYRIFLIVYLLSYLLFCLHSWVVWRLFETKAGIEGLAFFCGGLESKVIKYSIAYHQGYVPRLFAFEGCWKQKQVHIEGLAFLRQGLERKVSSKPHDFTGKDMEVRIEKKGRYQPRIALFIWRPGKVMKVHLMIHWSSLVWHHWKQEQLAGK